MGEPLLLSREFVARLEAEPETACTLQAAAVQS